MTWGAVRRRLVRVGGVAELVVVAAVASSFVGSLAGPLWRQSRPGCVVNGLVTCTPSGVDQAGRWPAFAVGALVALVAATASHRVRRVAQVLVVVIVASGTALFAADQVRWAAPRVMVCDLGYGHGCTYPAWHLDDLVTGAGVGLVFALLALAGESASRRALDVPTLGARRILVGVLMVGAVPLGIYGAWAVALAGTDRRQHLTALALVSVSIMGLVVGQALRTAVPAGGERDGLAA